MTRLRVARGEGELLRRLAERYDGVVSDLVDVHLGLVPDERFIARSVYTSGRYRLVDEYGEERDVGEVFG